MASAKSSQFFHGILKFVRIGSIGTAFCLAALSSSFAATLKVGGTGSALGAMRTIGLVFEKANPGVTVEVAASLGSGGGIAAAIAGALDIGLSARRLKNKELKAGGRQQAYARTPFTLVTSNRDVVPSLTTEQILGMFACRLEQWPDGTPVRIVLRPEDDSDNTVLLSGIKGIRPALAKARALPGIPVGATDQEAMSLAEALPGSLTTASLTSIVSERRPLVPIAIDGIAPTLRNLAEGRYPMSKTLYLVTGPKLTPLAETFIRFLRSPEGEALLRETGNLPLMRE